MMYARSCPSLPRAQRQRGVVLMVALIFLVLLTILALSASGRSLLQERMAGGLRNTSLADMAAETTLRGVEWKLWTSTTTLTATPLLCGTGVLSGNCYRYDPSNTALYGASGTVTKFRTGQGWITTGTAIYTGADSGTDFTKLSGSQVSGALAKNPVYLIEDMGVELPPGASGGLHESGVTGSSGTGPGSTSRHVYRITARATGADANTVRVMESTFAAKSN
jgi:type IV pilus assembly protein PilX